MNRVNLQRTSSKGFTLVELLVVISILVIILGLAVPAFNAMITSSQRSLVENQFRAGIIAARDAAIQSDGGDGAALFTFEPGGRLSIVPCVQVGTVRDLLSADDPSTQSNVIERDVFVPVANSEAVQLPAGWTVRGYAGPYTTDGATADPSGWYEGQMWASRRKYGNWIFPETGFYDPAEGDEGRKRQSFIVRFRHGTGELETADRRTALVIDVVPDAGFRDSPPWSTARLDRSENLALLVRRLVAQVNDTQGLLTNEARWIGDISTDSVLVRPVTELALIDESKMAAAIGAPRLNKTTRSLYSSLDSDPTLPAINPELDTSLFTEPIQPDEVVTRINEWIEGRYKIDDEPVESDARIFTFQQYAGQLQEIKP